MTQSKTIEEIYQKKDLHQHILDRPDTYIGSNKIVTEEQAIFENDSSKIVKKIVEYNPALIKIFDEILVNAIDHTVRDTTASFIKVEIKDNTISVMNNGKGIPVVKHKEHNVYIPEMIFGQLLTSSNYNDNDKRVVGGRNGLGSKLTCVYSKYFCVETIDAERGLYYKQEFTDNMYSKSKPELKKSKLKPYTKITFQPDYNRFHMKSLTPDTLSLMTKRVYDCIACTNKNVSVYFNDVKLKEKDFQQYISLYTDKPLVYEKYEKDDFVWEYAVHAGEAHNQVSFVNGIATSQGGRHVEYILNQIIKKLLEMIQSKKKIENIKTSYIKDKLCIFVKSTIVNPNFSSQTKEFLTTPVKDFGCKVEVSDAFITKIYKTSGIVEEIISFTKYKNDRELQKTSTTSVRRQTKLFITNLDDAHNAGTSKSKNCTLILTEGLSAKTFAQSGVSVIGRDNYGIFPLKGKLLNVREATQKQLLENEEINNLKQIIGLQHGKKYSSVDSLRYGRICILTDQDYDGSHIKGLIVNLFHTWWRELLDIPDFIVSMKTPIVKISKGKESKSFYTIKDYKDWEASINNPKTYNIKYYKGLGTSTANDAKDIFKAMKNNIIRYLSPNKIETDKAIILAFEKKQSDARKDWLLNYNFEMTLDQAENDVTYSELINKELIHFSMYDVIRSIPCICDGLKPSQRKVIHTLLTNNYSKEIKVAQLGASVAEKTSYHHGEASLQGTIINMAQDFIGSNNINLLRPNGQFGSRLTSNGKDAASARYIFTELNEITKKLFLAEDTPILKHQEEEGQSIEPVYYVPVLPMVLINGTQGIGTGYSTNIPCYNPKEIISNMKRLLEGKEQIEMAPWYRGYKGPIEKDDKGNFTMKGIYKIEGKVLHITEIPIGIGISDYKEFLEKIVKENLFNTVDVKNNSTEVHADFSLIFADNASAVKFAKENNITKVMKLEKSISTKNFHLLNENGTITKYNSAEEILESFYKIRLNYNVKRREHLINSYTSDLELLKNKIRFLTEIIDGKLVVYKKSKKELDVILNNGKYLKIENSYNYLTSMPIYSFTKEKIEELNTKINNISAKLTDITNKNNKNILSDDLEKLDL